LNFRLINTEYIESVSGGDKEIIRELVGIFKDQAIEFSEEMKSLQAAKDYTALGMLAHKAKSSVAILGMADLAVMLKTFELDAKCGKDIQNYPGFISRFETETKEAVVELSTYLNNL
jgi:HPt (histidine-containing phosphotransfer) domain-containing protein